MKKALKSILIRSNQARAIIMKRTTAPLVVLACMFLAGAAPHAQARDCSIATLHGAYGVSLGTILVPPLGLGTSRGVLGRLIFDGRGNVSSALTINTNGTVTHITDVGTYTIDPDCTGKIYSNVVPGTIEIVVVDGGKEFYQLRTEPAGIIVLFNAAKKQAPGDNEER